MSLNNTPSANRLHITLFGRRNSGKSSLINALTRQNTALVSDIPGTTTDPVKKAMELLPLGPVVIIDTPGIDDVGELGGLRVQKTYQILNKTDIAVLVIDGRVGMTAEDTAILERIKDKNIPYVVVKNKADLFEVTDEKLLEKTGGIVQGMSGSPIIQDNKIIGAVTHVLIDNVKKGYGIYIEYMLQASDMG